MKHFIAILVIAAFHIGCGDDDGGKTTYSMINEGTYSLSGLYVVKQGTRTPVKYIGSLSFTYKLVEDNVATQKISEDISGALDSGGDYYTCTPAQAVEFVYNGTKVTSIAAIKNACKVTGAFAKTLSARMFRKMSDYKLEKHWVLSDSNLVFEMTK